LKLKLREADMKRSLLLIFVLAMVFSHAPAQAVDWRDYYTWEAVIFHDDGSEQAKLKIGASGRATDGYDGIYEVDAYTSGSLRPYFYHPEWGRGGISGGTDYYWSDIRSESLPQTWDYYVQDSSTGRNVTLTWDLSHLEPQGCSVVELALTDTANGQTVVLTEAQEYVYYNSTTSPHSFRVVATEGAGPKMAAPSGLRSNPGGGQIVLHWDADAGVSGYRVYRDGVLLNADTLVTDDDGDGTAAFGDSSAGGPSTYTYTVTSVSELGCESEEATIEVTR
jgi:hypothetical protein